MIDLASDVRMAAERPAFQWDAVRGMGPLTLRLFGRLGARELARVVETIALHARAPRDLVFLDLSEVRHVDYRAIPEFASSLLRQRERGAGVWIVGMSAYVRSLFGVAGEGMTLGRLEWNPGGEPEHRRFFPFAPDRYASAAGHSRERV